MIAILALLAQVTMNLSSTQQTMDCFGASGSIFGDNGTVNEGGWSETAIDAIFDPGKGIGATCVRMGIANADDGTGSRFEDANPGHNNTIRDLQRIKLRVGSALKILVSPWSPNIACKSNSSVIDGNYVGSPCDASWAAYNAAAVDDMINAGVKPDFVSWQNEPGTNGANCAFAHEDACWTAAQGVSYMKVLGPLLTSRGVGLTGPETSQWAEAQAHIDACVADSTCLAQMSSIVTAHQYTVAISAPLSTGSRRTWMTEWSDAGTSNTGMTGGGGGLDIASKIHTATVTGNASAWFHWWGVTSHSNTDDGLFEINEVASKRLYVLGNWSKFVRPGMVRFGITGSPPANVSVSTYKDPTSNNIAIPVVNNQASTQALTVTLDATSKCKVATPWITDATHNLTAGTPINLVASVISYTLTANSVTTLVCNGT